MNAVVEFILGYGLSYIICLGGLIVLIGEFILLPTLLLVRKVNPDFMKEKQEKAKHVRERTEFSAFLMSDDISFKYVKVCAILSIFLALIVSIVFFSINGFSDAKKYDISSPNASSVSSSSSSSSSTSDDGGPIPHIEHEPYYILNTNTGKYHRPACGIGDRISNYNRRVSYDTSDEIRAQGYSPCGKCCP
ncbi:MAG: hypothetical protein IKY33_01600 [Clostridia bacterium]|nr:hypothetical protein [Clostridia bacterium]